ncbi:MAG: nitrous oxide reductase family maturation protein NosD [Spirosomataceae bacterium]
MQQKDKSRSGTPRCVAALNPFSILSLVFGTLLSFCIQAHTLIVKPTQNLHIAIQQAAPYDTILIQKGVFYVNNILINKPLVIIGQNFPILDGQFKSEIFTITASNVTVKGIHFQNVGMTSMIDWATIKVLEARHVRIIGNRVRNSYFGIYLSASDHCLVQGNDIQGHPKEEQNTGNGIHAWKCDSIRIEANRIAGHRDGIYFEFVTNSTIQHNDSQQNIRYGLHFMFSHLNAYLYNHFHKNGAGVAVMYTKFVTMKHNIFEQNWGGAAYGLLLKDISDSHIEQNIFNTNTVGVYMEGCSRSVFSNNQFIKNGYAIRVQANCDDNTLVYSNFKGNTFDVATNGDVVLTKVAHNYWDKYEGYDLNRDGIGDVPFRPVSLYASVIERIPQGMMLLRSFTVTLLDRIEKIIPSITPEGMKDESPMMKPIQL